MQIEKCQEFFDQGREKQFTHVNKAGQNLLQVYIMCAYPIDSHIVKELVERGSDVNNKSK